MGLLVAVLALALLPVARLGSSDWVTRLVYGERGDPYAAVSRLAASTERVGTRGAGGRRGGPRRSSCPLRVPWALVTAGDAPAQWRAAAAWWPTT